MPTLMTPLERLSLLAGEMTAAVNPHPLAAARVSIGTVRRWRDDLVSILTEQVHADAKLHRQIVALREMVDIRETTDRDVIDLLDSRPAPAVK